MFFRCEDCDVYCYSAALKECSLFFVNFFSGKLQESCVKAIVLRVDEGIRSSAVSQAINGVNTGTIVVKSDDVLEQLRFAHKYELEDIKDVCNKFLLNKINCGNALVILPFAEVFCSDRVIKKCRYFALKDSIERGHPLWPLNPAFIGAEAETVLAYLSDRKLKCDNEQEVFVAIVHWFKADTESRGGMFLGNILETCVSASDLNPVEVKKIVASLSAEELHQFSAFVMKLPAASVTTLPVPRSHTKSIECIICHASFENKVSDFTLYLNDQGHAVLGPQGDDVYSNVDEIAHIRGAVLTKDISEISKVQPCWDVKGWSQLSEFLSSRPCSYVFELCTNIFENGLLTVSFVQDKLHVAVVDTTKRCRLGISKNATFKLKKDEVAKFFIFITWERFLFGLQPTGNTVHVYDISTLEYLGALLFNCDGAAYFATAQKLNVCVLVGLRECRIVLLDKAVKTKSGRSALSTLPFGLRFEVPDSMTQEHTWDKTAEILGNRLVIIQADKTTKEVLIMSRDLNPIIANSGQASAWKKQFIDVNVLLGKRLLQLQWLDAQRIRKTRAEFYNFNCYNDDTQSDVEIDDK